MDLHGTDPVGRMPSNGMSTELVADSTPVQTDDASNWVVELGRWEDFILSATSDEAAEAVARARTIREIVKIRKLATEIAAAASRVEIIALRRLGQLEAFGALPGIYKSAARTLANIDDETFKRYLATQPPSAITMARRIADDIRQAEERTEAPRRIRSVGDYDPSMSIESVQRSARNILGSILARNQPTTVADAADTLLSELDIRADSITSLAAREIVRDSIGVYDAPSMNWTWEGVPQFITFQNDDGDWIRIPSRVANVRHLRWMADYRREQAKAMADSADHLEWAAKKCEQTIVDYELTDDLPIIAALTIPEEARRAPRYGRDPKETAHRLAQTHVEEIELLLRNDPRIAEAS